MVKLSKGENENQNLHLNKSIATVTFEINETIKFTLIISRDVVLPLDNLLKPRRIYVGKESPKILIEHQHKIFLQPREYAELKRNQKVNRKTKEVKLTVGDPVFYKAW